VQTKTLFAAALLGSVLTSTLHAALEFCGYTIIGGVASCSLEDTTDRSSSPWITIGKSFHGYKIAGFDAAKETLAVENPEGATIQLPLRSSKIKEAPVRISGTIKFGARDSVEVTKATLVMGEETTFTLNNGVTLRIKPSPFPNNAVRYDAVFEAPQPDGTRKVLSSPSIVAQQGKSFGIEIGDLGFAFGP
jgi:hypothetical protein